MKKTLIVPILLLATTPFVVGCTKKPTDIPPPPPVTGTTETVAPVETVVPVAPVQSGSAATETVAPVVLTRTETLSYDSKTPEGMVDVEFSVTVTDGTITAASATPKTDKQGSNYNQTNFAKALSGAVVGKKAKDLDVDAIGGSSLTTAAFETFVHSF